MTAPTTVSTATSGSAPEDEIEAKPPLYWRLLRLRLVRPNGWQRAVLFEGVTAVAVTLELADVASAWTLLVLPLASVVAVKGHDVLVGMLGTGMRGAEEPTRRE